MAAKEAYGLLWFAWKIVLLQYHKHHLWNNQEAHYGCDLLEKSYFCSITNIGKPNKSLSERLWFAWKIVLLQYHKHRSVRDIRANGRCDLLEKSYFCSITNIRTRLTPTARPVVICLKNRTFAVSQTSRAANARALSPLWFAWKIVLLQYHKHLGVGIKSVTLCCDLLEKSYFCSITNIKSSERTGSNAVVICLKNRTFAVSQTSQNLINCLAL